MRLKSFILFILFCVATELSGQCQAWWVFFTDKSGSTFDPYAYFDQAAIDRRNKNGISLTDSTDFPVSPDYLNAVAAVVDTMGYASRWLNAVGVAGTPSQIEKLKMFPFVKAVVPQGGFEWIPAQVHSPIDSNGNLDTTRQVALMKGEEFAKRDINGRGIRIAILDAGFSGTDSHVAFTELRHNNQIKKTWNFVHNDSIIYDEKTDHGTMVLSCIAGMDNGSPMGLAPKADFMLGIISKEYGNQYRSEERYIAGVEWADRYGANIINISGGPNENAYFAEDMDGKTPLISQTCKIAARKGILVVAAAGNNGSGAERQLLPPAETDSVLSVTALGLFGYAADYSAVGPPQDFRRKPDVCAAGDVFVAAHEKKKDVYAEAEGTSFSTPLIVGFAACVMQLYPDISAMGMIDTLHVCAHLYPYYDYSHGYGVPQADYFFRKEILPPDKTFEFAKNNNSVGVNVTANADSLSSDAENNLLFWSLSDSKGRIVRYEVIEMTTPSAVLIQLDSLSSTGQYKLSVCYRRYYAETDL
jgi:subtilisin family serine protease